MNEMLLWSISCVSIGFCIDLIQTIRNPFSRFEYRLNKIQMVLLVGNFMIIIYSILLFNFMENLESVTGLKLEGINDVFYRSIITLT
jgi:hypothetical protein